jgi:hypothetical protein
MEASKITSSFVTFEHFWSFYTSLVRSFETVRVIDAASKDEGAIKDLKEKIRGVYGNAKGLFLDRSESADYSYVEGNQMTICLNLESVGDNEQTLDHLVRLCNLGDTKVRSLILQEAISAGMGLSKIDWYAQHTCLLSADFATCSLHINVSIVPE